MFRTIKNSLALALCSLATLGFGIVGVFLSLAAPRFVIPLAVRPWGRALLLSLGARLTVSGEENIPLEPSVIMYNHQSSVDIPALVASLPGRYKLVMKDEVLKIPFVGWVSRLNGHFFVSRDGGGGDSKQLKIMTRAIREKNQTLVLAPEGTRSESGQLLDFKKGGFLLAALSGAPVVPMVIRGGRAIKPKRGPLKTGGAMTVEFLPPVRTAETGGRAAMEALEHGTREAMLRALDGNRQDGDNLKDGGNLPDGNPQVGARQPDGNLKVMENRQDGNRPQDGARLQVGNNRQTADRQPDGTKSTVSTMSTVSANPAVSTVSAKSTVPATEMKQ